MTRQKLILDKQGIDKTLDNIARKIWESNREENNLVLIGICRRGVTIATRLSRKLENLSGKEMPVGALDINLYRDDLSEIASQPVLKKTEIPFTVKDREIILCDDVLYTGRTVRAALDSIIDMGRPKKIMLAVLIDRGYRELPIEPNFTAVEVSAGKNELVEVMLEEDDGLDQVIITENNSK